MSHNIGVWGCGNMAQLAHLPVLQSLPEAMIKVCGDIRPDVARRVATQYGAASAATLEELLEHDIDVVYLLTPAISHFNDISLALAAGKHIFCEKPLAMAVESVEKLKTIHQKTGGAIGLGYMKRYDVNINDFMSRARKDQWGDLLFVRTHAFIGGHWDAAIRDLTPVITSPIVPVPVYDMSKADPGALWMGKTVTEITTHPFHCLLDTGCHSVNLLRYLTGITPQVKCVTHRAGVRIVDFDFGKFIGTMEFCLNFAMNRWDEVTELYFSKASVRILTPPPLDRQSSSVVEIYSENNAVKEILTLADNHSWAFRNQSAAFLAKLPHVCDLDDAKQDIAIIQDIYQKENQ